MEIELQAPKSGRRWFPGSGGQNGGPPDGLVASPDQVLTTVGSGAAPVDLPVDADDALSCGPLWISPHEMCEVRVGGRRVAMSLSHLRMLACLLEAKGRVISREELYRVSGAAPLPQGSRRVDVHVARIRQSLGALGRFLVAVRRRGYRLDIAGLARSG